MYRCGGRWKKTPPPQPAGPTDSSILLRLGRGGLGEEEEITYDAWQAVNPLGLVVPKRKRSAVARKEAAARSAAGCAYELNSDKPRLVYISFGLYT
jgi:hypothetical protein